MATTAGSNGFSGDDSSGLIGLFDDLFSQRIGGNGRTSSRGIGARGFRGSGFGRCGPCAPCTTGAAASTDAAATAAAAFSRSATKSGASAEMEPPGASPRRVASASGSIDPTGDNGSTTMVFKYTDVAAAVNATDTTLTTTIIVALSNVSRRCRSIIRALDRAAPSIVPGWNQRITDWIAMTYPCTTPGYPNTPQGGFIDFRNVREGVQLPPRGTDDATLARLFPEYTSNGVYFNAKAWYTGGHNDRALRFIENIEQASDRLNTLGEQAPTSPLSQTEVQLHLLFQLFIVETLSIEMMLHLLAVNGSSSQSRYAGFTAWQQFTRTLSSMRLSVFPAEVVEPKWITPVKAPSQKSQRREAEEPAAATTTGGDY